MAIAIAAISKRNIREGIVKRHSHHELHPIESINSIGHATNRKDVRVDTGTCPQQTALLVGDVLAFIPGTKQISVRSGVVSDLQLEATTVKSLVGRVVME